MDKTTEQKIDRQYIAVLRYEDKKPVFHKEKIIVSASDVLSAMMQLDLMGISHTDAIRYIDNDQIYLFDKENNPVD